MKTAPTVVFDTSVFLSGLASPDGGSAKLLRLCRTGHINGVLSKTILHEALSHAEKLHIEPEWIAREAKKCFRTILPAPDTSLIDTLAYVPPDPDDIHLLVSSKEIRADYLVTLDQRHLLKNASVIKDVAVVSPKQLIQRLQKA